MLSRLECDVAAENYKSGIGKKQKYRIKIIKKFQETCTCKGSCGGPSSQKTSKGTFRFHVKYMRDPIFRKATDSEHLQFSKHSSPERTSTVQKNWTFLLTKRRKVQNHHSIHRWQRLFRGEEPSTRYAYQIAQNLTDLTNILIRPTSQKAIVLGKTHTIQSRTHKANAIPQELRFHTATPKIIKVVQTPKSKKKSKVPKKIK